MSNYNFVINPAKAVEAPMNAWRCLTAGVPLTLLIDLAAGEALDSRGVFAAEEVGTLVGAALAELGMAPGSVWTRARSA
jgi:hypothetical protein